QGERSAWSLCSQVPWAIILLAGLIAGFYAMAGWLGAALVTASLLLGNFLIVPAFSYLQHYGTIRVEGEPYQPHHIIEHRTFFARAATVDIVTHTNHHVDPYVPFYELKPSDIDNKMPSAILCFLISLIPPLWSWYARPYLRNIDLLYASPAEQALAREANRKAGWPDWFDEQAPATLPELGTASS
ncbi:MAG: fatty acid desaturase, partial [Alphaproteobacteria bacterium]|nr:fatty acid desaturase [Alphaproteobacteria bacterium]